MATSPIERVKRLRYCLCGKGRRVSRDGQRPEDGGQRVNEASVLVKIGHRKHISDPERRRALTGPFYAPAGAANAVTLSRSGRKGGEEKRKRRENLLNFQADALALQHVSAPSF